MYYMKSWEIHTMCVIPRMIAGLVDNLLTAMECCAITPDVAEDITEKKRVSSPNQESRFRFTERRR